MPPDFPPNPLEKPGYSLEFGEDFQGASLDLNRWLPYYLPHWSSRSRSAARYSLPGNCLRLHIEAGQQPWSPEYDGGIRVSSLQTGCFSGPVGSPVGQHHFRPGLLVSEAQPATRLYTPRYGYFETRLRAVPIPGYLVTLWMIGFEDRLEHSAEICICEIFGHEMTEQSARIGYGLHPFGDPWIRDEFYRDAMPIHAAGYHIYAVEWTPAQVAFFIDNVKTKTLYQSPDYPMQFMLGLYEIPDHLRPEVQRAAWPVTAEVDYFRGYRPAAGYDGL